MIRAQDKPATQSIRFGMLEMEIPADVRPRRAQKIAKALQKAMIENSCTGSWSYRFERTRVRPQHKGQG